MTILRIIIFPFALLFFAASTLFTVPLLIIDKGIYNDNLIKKLGGSINSEK